MITDSFLNSCFSVILCKNPRVKKDKALVRDIQTIIEFYNKKEKITIPVIMKNKVECLIKVCKMKLEDKTNDNIVDSVCLSEKYKAYGDFLTHKITEDIPEISILDNVKQIRLRKKLNSLVSNYDELSKFLETLKDGSFESIDDIVLDYENIVKELYSNMMDSNRNVAIEASSSLDLCKDKSDSVLELIKSKYSKLNATSSGFPLFDNEILNGGFEPSRLYLIGGGSGSGKSTLLANFIINSATANSSLSADFTGEVSKYDGINAYVYISLENTIDETLLRIYQKLKALTLNQAVNDVKNGVDIQFAIATELKKTKSTIIIKYFAPQSISPLDLTMVLDDVISEYGQGSIRGLYVDYLDLLACDLKYDLNRLELGHITVSLKTLAVYYNIPVIVATQLGRSIYRVTDARELNLDQMSESIKKVEHSDFVLLMARDSIKDGIVHAKAAKNRNGKANVSVDFTTDFATFRFLSVTKLSNDKKSDVTNAALLGFEGLKGSI
jgi:replicative DNA helicase